MIGTDIRRKGKGREYDTRMTVKVGILHDILLAFRTTRGRHGLDYLANHPLCLGVGGKHVFCTSHSDGV